jgi:hypothetical protein
MRYNVRFGLNDVKGRPQDVVVIVQKNTKSCVTTPASMTCVIRPVEPVSLYFRDLSARSPQVIHRVLHTRFSGDSSDFPPIFRMFCTPFSAMIAVHIPWMISAAFSQRIRRQKGRKAGGDPKSVETAEKRFRKAGWTGIRVCTEKNCTENVARGTLRNQ